MPNCKVHEDCDLVCIECGDYYCRGEHDMFKPSVITLWAHVPRYEGDMPDDREEYYNERAERMP